MKAAVIMGSASDEAKVEKGIAILKEYGVDVEVRALSAHRAHRALSADKARTSTSTCFICTPCTSCIE